MSACGDATQVTARLQAHKGEEVQNWWDAAPAAYLVVSAGMG